MRNSRFSGHWAPYPKGTGQEKMKYLLDTVTFLWMFFGEEHNQEIPREDGMVMDTPKVKKSAIDFFHIVS